MSSHADRARLILKGANYSSLFAYLWRRFGPPPSGWDDHKELVSYWISSPVPGIAFGISCSPSFETCGAGIFYAIDQKWSARIDRWERGERRRWMKAFAATNLLDSNAALAVEDIARGETEFWSQLPSPSEVAACKRVYREFTERAGPCPRYRHFDEWPGMEFAFDRPPVPISGLEPSPHRIVLAAIEHGLRDLLRPVQIRDRYVNACGPVSDRRWRSAVDRCPLAGLGVPVELMAAGDSWFSLLDEINKRGVAGTLSALRGQDTPALHRAGPNT